MTGSEFGDGLWEVGVTAAECMNRLAVCEVYYLSSLSSRSPTVTASGMSKARRIERVQSNGSIGDLSGLRVPLSARPSLSRNLTGDGPVGPAQVLYPVATTSPTVEKWLARVLRDECVVDATAHQLRHWYATALLRQGASVRVVQDALGHASLAKTALYLRVTITGQATYATGLTPTRKAA